MPLYHYTTQPGLLGIIGETQIWATHTQFLNDRREFLHGIDLARYEIDELFKTTDAQSRTILRDMASTLSGAQNINICVCSFSEHRDSLSQWRAYGSRTSGFAIGFPGDFLAAAVGKHQWYLAPCIYDPAEQRKLVRSLVEEVLDEEVSQKAGHEADELYSLPGGNFGAYFNRYAPILKDRAFAEEREWRIISRPLSCKLEPFGFREGGSLLIPYYKFPLAGKDLAFRLQEVVVGPTPDDARAKRSVSSLLVRHDLGEVPVDASAVPYRGW